MKTLLILIIGFLGIQAFGQGSFDNCSRRKPSFCVNEPAYVRGYYGTIRAYDANNVYVFVSNGGTMLNNVSASEIYRATLGTKGASRPQLYVGEAVYAQGYYGKITGVNADGQYVFYSNGGTTVPNLSIDQLYKLTPGTCGRTRPQFCVNEPTFTGGYHGKIVGVGASNGKYVFYSNGGTTLADISVEALPKVQKGSASSSAQGLSCEYLDIFLSDTPSDVLSSYAALATVTTTERAEYLTEISKYLVSQNQAESTLFARLVFAKVVKSSTAKFVQDNFAKPVQDDLKELEKIGWKSIDQIEAKVSTLDFAIRVLAAGVKLRMSMPDANDSMASFRSRLAATVAEPKLSAKIATLQGIVKDMQPLLLDLMQDPRHGALGEVTQDVAGWILKN